MHLSPTARSSCLYTPRGGSKHQSNFSCWEPLRCCGAINSKEDGFQPEWSEALIILDSCFCKKIICCQFFMFNCQRCQMPICCSGFQNICMWRHAGPVLCTLLSVCVCHVLFLYLFNLFSSSFTEIKGWWIHFNCMTLALIQQSSKSLCGSGVEPASCYRKVAVRFPWQACWSVLGQDTGPQTAPDVLELLARQPSHQCMYCISELYEFLWVTTVTKVSAKCPKCNVSKAKIPQLKTKTLILITK